MAKQQEFTCPRCGSHEYGTDLNGVWGGKPTVMRVCHGTTATGASCPFAWPLDDDRRYFTDTEYDAPEGPFVATTGEAPRPQPLRLQILVEALDRWRAEVGAKGVFEVDLVYMTTSDRRVQQYAAGSTSHTDLARQIHNDAATFARAHGGTCSFKIIGRAALGPRDLGWGPWTVPAHDTLWVPLVASDTPPLARANLPGAGAQTVSLSDLVALLEKWRQRIGAASSLGVDLLYRGEVDEQIVAYVRNEAGTEAALAKSIADEMMRFTAAKAKTCAFAVVGTRDNADMLGRADCLVEYRARESAPKTPMNAAVAEAAAGATTAPRNSIDVQEIMAVLKGARDLYDQTDGILLRAYDLQSPAEACVVVRSNSVGEDGVRAGQVGAGILNRAATVGGPCHFVLIVEDARNGRHLASMRFAIEVRAAVAEAPAAPPAPAPAVAPVVDPAAPESAFALLSASLLAQLKEWSTALAEGSGEKGRMLLLHVEQHSSGPGTVASYQVKTDHELGIAAHHIATRLESFTRALGRRELDFMIYAKDALSGVLLGRQPALCTIEAPASPASAPTDPAALAAYPIAPDRSREELSAAILAELRAWANALMMSSAERHRAIVLDLEQVHGRGAWPIARYVVYTDHDLDAAADWIRKALERTTADRGLTQADFMLYAKDQQSGAALGWSPARCTLDGHPQPKPTPEAAATPPPAPRSEPVVAKPRVRSMADVIAACARVAHNAMRALRIAVLADHADLEWELASADDKAVSLAMAQAAVQGMTLPQIHDIGRVTYLTGAAMAQGDADSVKGRPYYAVRFHALPTHQQAAFAVFHSTALATLKSLRALGSVA